MWLGGGAGRGWVSSEKILIGWQDGVEQVWKEEGEEASVCEGTPVSSGGVPSPVPVRTWPELGKPGIK